MSMHPPARQATAPDRLDVAALPLASLPAFGQRPSKPLEPSRDELVRSLRKALGEMHQMCGSDDDPLGPVQKLWPNNEWLANLSAIIRRLASLLKRGGPTTWSCIRAIERRYPALKLCKRIETLVDRAARLRPEREAITIQKQGIAGNEAARKCFEDLEKCHNGQSKIASIDWEEYRDILEPLPGESCAVKAAQICYGALNLSLLAYYGMRPGLIAVGEAH